MSETNKEIPYNLFQIESAIKWVEANGLTPYIIASALMPEVKVPQQFINTEDGSITLNIRKQAIGNFQLDQEALSFSGRFSGKEEKIYLPLYAVKVVYAKENGKAIFMASMDVPEHKDEPEVKLENNKPTLSLVTS